MAQVQCPNCDSYKLDPQDGGSCGCAVYSAIAGGALMVVDRLFQYPAPIIGTLWPILLGVAFLAFIYYNVYTSKHFICENCGKRIDL
jgi:hypothetical protein